MKVSLRPIESADAKLLAAMHKLGFADAWDEKAFVTLLGTPGVFGVLAGLAQPLGFMLCRSAADEAEILTLMVPESYRRHGVATALLDGALAEAATRKVKALFLEVAETNDAARAFYAARAFAEVGRRKRYYQNKIDALMMRREVGS